MTKVELVMVEATARVERWICPTCTGAPSGWCDRCLLAAVLGFYTGIEEALDQMERRLTHVIAIIQRICPDELPIRKPDAIN